MGLENLNLNDKAFLTLKARGGILDNFVAFVDGDLVEQGDSFPDVAINAGELRSQRGSQAQLTIYDRTLESKITV